MITIKIITKTAMSHQPHCVKSISIVKYDLVRLCNDYGGNDQYGVCSD